MPTLTTRTRSSRHARRATPAPLRAYFAAKLAAELGPHDLHRLIEDGQRGFIILDVRSPEGYAQGRLPGARHIPYTDLARRLQELPKQQEIITYCWNVTCLLCTKASLLLASRGFRTRELIGGIAEWTAAGFPVERSHQLRLQRAVRRSDQPTQPRRQ